jgi:hypothetical protein
MNPAVVASDRKRRPGLTGRKTKAEKGWDPSEQIGWPGQSVFFSFD